MCRIMKKPNAMNMRQLMARAFEVKDCLSRCHNATATSELGEDKLEEAGKWASQQAGAHLVGTSSISNQPVAGSTTVWAHSVCVFLAIWSFDLVRSCQVQTQGTSWCLFCFFSWWLAALQVSLLGAVTQVACTAHGLCSLSHSWQTVMLGCGEF